MQLAHPQEALQAGPVRADGLGDLVGGAPPVADRVGDPQLGHPAGHQAGGPLERPQFLQRAQRAEGAVPSGRGHQCPPST
ncbi:hypothetical protein RGF97_06360 [Streptomyces roseicoloratus]|uniref:Uncharacterized protein n=1 Tax=Streptomyces roseicoloratus TaxID=2508722 RepID=A0ABY9RSU6_9ACTN|nr:hypothetical protein [Streptomyces roseicoloratus]WMX44551.1 hypothetical protein RGF97_06360 [Streptomyces roseicoloratus]